MGSVRSELYSAATINWLLSTRGSRSRHFKDQGFKVFLSGVLIIGSSGNFSDGSYHGRLGLTPVARACAINLPISSPSRDTSALSASYL